MNTRLAPNRFGQSARTIFALLACALLPMASISAQEMEVPVALQVPLFLKVMTFDRQRPQNDGSEVVFGVAYQSGFRNSVLAKEHVAKALRAEARVRVVLIDLDKDLLEPALRQHHVQMLYISPLRAINPASIATAAANARVTTVTGVPQYVEQGVAVGLRLQGERPKIMVNLAASKLCGADFTSELLKLAEVYQ